MRRIRTTLKIILPKPVRSGLRKAWNKTSSHAFNLMGKSYPILDLPHSLDKDHPLSLTTPRLSRFYAYHVGFDAFASPKAFDTRVNLDVRYLDRMRSPLTHFSGGVPFGFSLSIPMRSIRNSIPIYLRLPKGAACARIELSTQSPVQIFLHSIELTPVPLLGSAPVAEILNDFTARFARRDTPATEKELHDFVISTARRFEFDPKYVLGKVLSHATVVAPELVENLAAPFLLKDLDLEELRKIFNALRSSGNIRRSMGAYERILRADRRAGKLTLFKLRTETSLLQEGYPWPARRSRAYRPDKNVIYLLHNSLPYNSGGYATRTHGLIGNVTRHTDFTVRALARPGYPTDHQAHISKKLPRRLPAVHRIGDVEYHIGAQDMDRAKVTFEDYLDRFCTTIETMARRHSTGIIHGASNYPNGIAAVRSARMLGMKSVYEVRGLWEITRLSRQPSWSNSEYFAMNARMEAEALRQADAKITITKALKNLMIDRGVDGTIHVIPNAVDTSHFFPKTPDPELRARLGISSDEVVIGYAGSIVEYEGLDDLLFALRRLRGKNTLRFKALIVGDGASLPDLRKLSTAYGLDSIVTFTGRVPHSDVSSYISVMDIMPFPRKPYEVCEIVSPLKPFESLASEKVVVVSSCDALTEIVQDGETGLVFEKGNIDDLAAKLEKLILNLDLRKALAARGLSWVRAERDWKTVAKRAAEIYQDLYERMAAEPQTR